MIRPILFNTEMVRAILDGRKTVTRRLVKLPNYIKKQDDKRYTLYADGTCYENQNFEQIVDYMKKPYQMEDILYVRETVWQKTGHYLDIDGETKAVFCEEFHYVATDEEPEVGWNYSWAKRPSIHMPKEAARIWLKVTNVRVERLQEIDAVGCLQEGIESEYPHVLNGEEKRYAFSQLWNSTIKKFDIDTYGWDANPWVWVIEFERCEKPDEAAGSNN